jgi:hypothetical protein
MIESSCHWRATTAGSVRSLQAARGIGGSTLTHLDPLVVTAAAAGRVLFGAELPGPI